MSFKLITGALLAATVATAALAQVAPPPPAPAPMAPQGWGKMQRSESRAEVVQRTQRLFARLDRNRDGVLTQDELALAGEGGRGDRAERAPGMAPPAPGGGDRAQAMFDRVDANHDGVITRDEFAQAHAGMGAGGGHHMGRMAEAGAGRGEHGGMRGQMLMMADANRDGRITLQEMTDFALQRFDRMDLNHDGTVTPEERAQARGAMGQRRS